MRRAWQRAPMRLRDQHQFAESSPCRSPEFTRRAGTGRRGDANCPGFICLPFTQGVSRSSSALVPDRLRGYLRCLRIEVLPAVADRLAAVMELGHEKDS